MDDDRCGHLCLNLKQVKLVAPSDFALLPKLKDELKGKHFMTWMN